MITRLQQRGRMALSSSCQIKVADNVGMNRDCGATALGHCGVCHRSFCMSHQGWRGQIRYIDLCAPCASDRMRNESLKLEDRHRRTETAQARIRTAAERLAAVHAPGAVRRQRAAGSRKLRFGRSEAVYDELEPAWPVQDCEWDLFETHEDRGGWRRLPTGVTRNGDLVPLHISIQYEHAVRPAVTDTPHWISGSRSARQSRTTPEELEAIATALEARLTRH